MYMRKAVNVPNEQDFAMWNNQKINIHSHITRNFYKVREIRWCALGVNIRYEQNGKRGTHQRPVIIFRGFSKEVCWILPLTTSIKKNPYHKLIGVVEGKVSYVILSQIRLIDTKRLNTKIGIISEDMFNEIRKAIRDLI